MDYKKIIDALSLIQSICSEEMCETCPFHLYDINECGITYNEPDDWDINYFDNWRAFK